LNVLKYERRTSNIQHRPSEIEKKFHGVKMMNEGQQQGQEFSLKELRERQIWLKFKIVNIKN
jgi:hypothetical protein